MTILSNLKPRHAIFFVLCVFFSALFCVLGAWQLHRYHFKQDLLVASQNHQIAVSLTEQPAPFQQVKVIGEYQNALTMLVQNKLNEGRVGFEVLTPLKIPGQKKLLLVNRGWVPNNSPILLHLMSALGPEEVAGDIKWLNEYQFILGKNILQPEKQPLVMQKINISEISQLTHRTYYPFILRLNSNAADGFTRHWIITAVTPERHLGYAVQWFAMAFALVVAYLFFCRHLLKTKA